LPYIELKLYWLKVVPWPKYVDLKPRWPVFSNKLNIRGNKEVKIKSKKIQK